MVRNSTLRSLVWTLAVLVFCLPLRAHGPVHEQIARLDAQIAEDPANADLHWRRGRLYLVHEDWPAALADFDRVTELDPKLYAARILRAEALLGLEETETAIAEIEAVLALPDAGITPHDRSRAYLLLGRAREALAEPRAAAAAYERAIEGVEQPTPDHYLAAARAHAAAGRDQIPSALRLLEDGRQRLGSSIALERRALELEREIGDLDAALVRLDRLLEQSQRRESWLVEKAEVLVAAGRHDDARRSLEEAAAALEALPPARRGTRAMVELKAEIERLLAAQRVTP